MRDGFRFLSRSGDFPRTLPHGHTPTALSYILSRRPRRPLRICRYEPTRSQSGVSTHNRPNRRHPTHSESQASGFPPNAESVRLLTIYTSTPRFPGGIHVPPDSPNAQTPQPSRHCPASQTGSVPFPLQTIGASPPHTRCPDTANVHPAPETTTPLAHATPPSSGQQPTANRTARPPISPPALFRRPHLPHSPYADRQPAEPTFPLPFPDSRRTDTPPVSRRYYRRRMFHFLKK